MALCWLIAAAAQAHTENPTLVVVTVDPSRSVHVKADVDLSFYLGSTGAYYDFTRLPAAAQQQRIPALATRVLHDLRIVSGKPVALTLASTAIARGDRNEFVGDTSSGKLSTFEFDGRLDGRDPVRLDLPVGAQIDFPVAFTVRVPSKNFSRTRWLVSGMHESDPVDWANAPTIAQDVPAADGSVPDSALSQGSWRQLPEYFHLGFRHIVPEGADHILFVLGLFFLGISWRKLLTQTTAFTIAHATTLFLSVYGIVRLPSAYVEPLIALSIAFIAIENVWRPKLGPGRVAVVFAFGLIHGLGFAASLAEVEFPQREFIWALLGFNLGVDGGQLFVMALAFLMVGWFRNRSWYRARIAVPVSLLLAAVGLYWAVERVILYRDVYF
ncbi:MAG: hypothetical protein DI605_06440 [Sphingomonas sp.]|nr:MAG: hypothetical protein DI605_06440 [Sphingomonas sp.]